jgi:hypothetical protein
MNGSHHSDAMSTDYDSVTLGVQTFSWTVKMSPFVVEMVDLDTGTGVRWSVLVPGLG